MAPRQRIRARISKTGSARYMSHLDFMRTLERALRRSGLPITYTEGYNPHPKFSPATALPVGYSSEAEISDFFLDRYTDPYEFGCAMNGRLVAGVHVMETSGVALNSPALASLPQSSVYEVLLWEALPLEELESRVRGFMMRESIPYVRRRKEVSDGRPRGDDTGSHEARPAKPDTRRGEKVIDLRRAVLSLKVAAPSTITMWVTDCRPDEVLRSLDLDKNVLRFMTVKKTSFYVKPREKWLDPMEFDTLPGSAGRGKWGM